MSGSDASREVAVPDQDPADQSGENLTLGDVLREAGIEPAPTIHEKMAAALRPRAGPAGAYGARMLEVDDPPGLVAAWLQERAGRTMPEHPTWIRFVRADLARGAVLVLGDPNRHGEAELSIVSQPGVMSRGLIRDACRWAFYHLGLARVVLRIPADRPDLSDFALRARFKHEGTARLFYGGVLDAQIWAMTGPDCPWLGHPSIANSPADAAPPSSLKVH